MRLIADVSGAKHNVEIHQDGARLTAMIDGRVLELEASSLEAGVYVFKVGGKVFEVFVRPAAEQGKTSAVAIGGRELKIVLTDPKRLRGSRVDSQEADGLAEIRTAMPGKVVRINKRAGDPVETGEAVIVIEAMKMQNELKSPKAGVVQIIRVKADDTVSAGDVLAIIA
ncbi:MAG: hypothetical protein LC730_01015 [Acidobacteria bacterium]|nr:hypothetical protein [Acidobacteriota bacterium]MCA1608028.1 hypothetical protein [Acidobacteriota bacterium]